MTVTQFIAALLWTAALDIPRPEYWHHTYAMRDLAKMLRGSDNFGHGLA